MTIILNKFLSSFCFLPCSATLVRLQIVHATEDIDVHEEEVVGYIEQFVFLTALFQQIAAEGCQIE